jgi:hypothetical protein
LAVSIVASAVDANASAAPERPAPNRRRSVDRCVNSAGIQPAFRGLSDSALTLLTRRKHPIQLDGTVKEFRYTSPHSFIVLEVKGQDGNTVLWNLEGGAPSGLVRDGWTSKTLKPGDELELTIDPLRSGAPGGSWNVNKVKFKNGRPIVATH